MSIFSVMFFSVSFILIISHSFYSFVSMQPEFSMLLNQKNFFDNHIEISYAAFILLCTVITYTILIPVILRNKHIRLFLEDKMDGMEYEVYNIDRSMPIYVGFALVMNYLIIFIFLIYSYSYQLFPIWILDVIMLIWLMAPIFILAFFPTLIFMLFLLLIYNINDKTSDATPLTIIILLVCLIKKLDDADEFTISQNNFKNSLMESIILISDLMKKMYQNISSGDVTSQWANEQMEQAASNFMELATCVYFPKSNTLKSLINKLCTYLNVFSSGNYHELPREDVKHFEKISFNQKRSKVQKIIILFSFFAFMAFPIVLMVILEILFKINIQPFIQSLLTVLYIIWGITGFIYFSDNLTSDTKETLMDIVKFIIRRQ